MTEEAQSTEPTGWLRTMLARVRRGATRRRVLLGLAAAVLLSTFAVVSEALFRAHLVAPEDRVPTGLYTRPIAWNGAERSAELIGPMPGAPGESREPTALAEIPDQLQDAVLAVEDKRFRDHDGLDLVRIGGALVANIRAGGVEEGGSTITQQLAKNLFLSAARTPLRKLREAAIALVLESRYSKEQILEAYLNEIYLGQDHGLAIHGVAAASQYYFGESVQSISLAEAATLAGMIHAPNRLSPDRHPEAATARRDVVLALMAEHGRITPEELTRARRARMPTRVHHIERLESRYFRDAIGGRLPHGLPKRGAAVYTTLDAALQRDAEAAVRSGLARLGQSSAQAALIALDPRSGDLLAMVGGRDYGASQFNRAVDAHRQPGSAFKPFVALAALSRDGDEVPAYTLASEIEDEPLDVRTPQGPWRPANYDGTYQGEVTLRDALEQSLNVPFARIGLTIGPERIAETAHRFGIASPLDAVPSLALGSGEVTLLELVRAYGVFAASGRLAATRMVTASRIGHGVLVPRDAESVRDVADPATTYLVTSALEGVVEHGTGQALDVGQFPGDFAGKTGTSNDWRDAWFIVYSPTLVVGVWVGHDDGTSLHRTGATAALPIVERFLRGTDLDGAQFDMPEGIVERWVASGNGGWDGCDRREVFLQGSAPEEAECMHFDPHDWGIDLDFGNHPDWQGELREQAETWLKSEINKRFRDLLDR